MESMLQVVSKTVDKVASDPVVKEKGVEKCSTKFGDCGSFPALNDVDAVPETSDAGCYTESEWADSEDSASACSLQSDASSNAISGNSLVSDADSLAPANEEKPVKKCPSGGSIVTYDEAVPKLNDEGECKAAEERHRTGKCYPTDEQETSTNTAPRMAESAGKAWTDDKHCSYLNSIEATFVRSLYEQDYRAVDMSEQDQDCVESRPMAPGYLTYRSGGELFTSLQRGCYDQREYYRPHYIFAPSAPAVFASPWIQHFNPRIAPHGIVAGGAPDVYAGHTSSTSGFTEGIHCSNYMYQGVMEEVMESVPVVPVAQQAPQAWSNRYQSQHKASTSAPVRPEASIQAKKRACNLDSCKDEVYRPKKLKSTQQKLAKTDLELEEQFVLKQLNQREDGDSIGDRGWRLEGNQHRPTGEEELIGKGARYGGTPPQNPADGKRDNGEELSAKKEASTCGEPEEDWRHGMRDKRHDDEIVLERSIDPSSKNSSEKPHDCGSYSRQLGHASNLEDTPPQTDPVDDTHQHNAGVLEVVSCVNVVKLATSQSATCRLIALDEASVKSAAGYDEQDECNFVAKISPRACRTYTWGLLGTRRPLLSGNAKDTREDGTTAKEQ